MELSSRRRICNEAVKGRDELCINLFFLSTPTRFGNEWFNFDFLFERIHSKKNMKKKGLKEDWVQESAEGSESGREREGGEYNILK